MSRTESRYSSIFALSLRADDALEAGRLRCRRSRGCCGRAASAPAAPSGRCCRWCRTAARTPRADRSRSAAAWSACARRSCWCRRSSRRRRRRRASRSTRCRARATRAASPSPAPRRDLIHRHRREDVGAGGDLERHAGQERAGRARVIAAALDQVGRFVGEAAAQQHPVLERLRATAASAAARRSALRPSATSTGIDMPFGT